MNQNQFVNRLKSILSVEAGKRYIGFVQRGHQSASDFNPLTMSDKDYLISKAKAVTNETPHSKGGYNPAVTFIAAAPEFSVMDTQCNKLLHTHQIMSLLSE